MKIVKSLIASAIFAGGSFVTSADTPTPVVPALAISGITPAPKPDSFVMFLAGLGLMGAIAMRRNKASA